LPSAQRTAGILFLSLSDANSGRDSRELTTIINTRERSSCLISGFEKATVSAVRLKNAFEKGMASQLAEKCGF